jgi:putative transposase
VVIPGCPHHVTQRGNNRQDVFFVDDDRRVFLDLLAQSAARFGLAVEGYCLMTNHFHLLAVPKAENSLALALKWTFQIYAQYVNRMHSRCGHLWQNRFFSCPVDDAYYLVTMGYIERNPVRAKMARKAWLHPWSSAAVHCGLGDPAGLVDRRRWPKNLPPEQWQRELVAPQDEQFVARLHLCTARGRPLGSDSFISKLEHLVGRRLRPLPPGRPKTPKNSAGP